MTLAEYEQATQIKDQIKSIDEVVEALSRFEHACDPPTRMSAFDLVVDHTETKIRINLNEGEVVWIKDALESMKNCLQRQFDKL